MLARQKCEMQQLSHPKFQLKYEDKRGFFFIWKPMSKYFIFTLETFNIMLKRRKEIVKLIVRGAFLKKIILNKMNRISVAQPRTQVILRRGKDPQSSLFAQRCMWYLPPWSLASRSESKSHNIDARQKTSSIWGLKKLGGRI